MLLLVYFSATHECISYFMLEISLSLRLFVSSSSSIFNDLQSITSFVWKFMWSSSLKYLIHICSQFHMHILWIFINYHSAVCNVHADADKFLCMYFILSFSLSPLSFCVYCTQNPFILLLHTTLESWNYSPSSIWYALLVPDAFLRYFSSSYSSSYYYYYLQYVSIVRLFCV